MHFLLIFKLMESIVIWTYLVSESQSVVSDSLWPHGLYSPWNSPIQNTGVCRLSLLQGIFPTEGLNPGLLIAGGFFTSWATRETQAPGHEYQQNKETEAQETEINQGDRVAGEREGVPGWLPQRRSRFRGLSITGQRFSHPAVSCPWAGELLGQVASNSPFHVYKKYSTTVLCHNS